jgi:exoribonuclease R
MINDKWNEKIYSIFKNDINIPKFKQNNFNLDPIYGNIERVDLTNLEVYSIDPPGCTDADDAFSIITLNNYVHLYIHIADPTSYFSPDSELFKYTLERGQTMYLNLPPHTTKPNHLFPDDIIEKCSLTNANNAITVHTLLEPIYSEKKMFKIIDSKIIFSKINPKNHKKFTYEEASLHIFSDITLNLGVKIAQDFWMNRKHKSDNFKHDSLEPDNFKSDNLETNSLETNNFMFSDLFFTTPIIKDCIILKPDTKQIKVMKSMIGEFAIHANSVFAKGLLKTEGYDNNNIFFRSIKTIHTDLFDVIKNGDSAKYTHLNLSHDLLNTEHYTHATSPLRRASDCIVHFLLKSLYLNIESPFTENQLKQTAEHLTQRNKYFRNIQFKETKLRIFQWIAEELESRMNPIKLKVKVINYNKPYLNLLITHIDDMNVSISYCLRKENNNINNNNNNIDISKIKLTNLKYDENILPELDEYYN